MQYKKYTSWKKVSGTKLRGKFRKSFGNCRPDCSDHRSTEGGIVGTGFALDAMYIQKYTRPLLQVLAHDQDDSEVPSSAGAGSRLLSPTARKKVLKDKRISLRTSHVLESSPVSFLHLYFNLQQSERLARFMVTWAPE